MATKYFNNAEADGDWGNLDNWWDDAGFTVPAASLPGPSDNAVVRGEATSNSGDPVVLASLDIATERVEFVPMTVSGAVLIHDDGKYDANTLSAGSLTVTGDGTDFSGEATVAGAVVFADGATFNQANSTTTFTCTTFTMNGEMSGTRANGSGDITATVSMTMNGETYVEGGNYITPLLTLNDASNFQGDLTGDLVMNDASETPSGITVTGNVTLNDTSKARCSIPESGGFTVTLNGAGTVFAGILYAGNTLVIGVTPMNDGWLDTDAELYGSLEVADALLSSDCPDCPPGSL